MDDPRLTPARPDLAAKFLEGRVEAARFVDGIEKEIIAPVAPLRRKPSIEAGLESEALKGERVVVYDTNDEGWVWGQLQQDRYVGWLPASALATPGPTPTHQIVALRSFVFPSPSIKLHPVEALSFGSRVSIARMEGNFGVTATGGYLAAIHLAPLDWRAPDWVAIAERFLHVPYLWGGKSSLGIDCSGLVQTALTAAGIACPRDSDLQERMLGVALPGISPDSMQRGDLVFWKGHVAIALDASSLIHANAFHMNVAREPLAIAMERIRASGGGEPTSFRRLRSAETSRQDR